MEEQAVETVSTQGFTPEEAAPLPEPQPVEAEAPAGGVAAPAAEAEAPDVREAFRRAVAPELAHLRQADSGLYGGLDADRMLAEPRFLQLLGAGLSIEEAFSVLNRDRVNERMRQQARADVVRDIEARGIRPAEGAAHPSGVGGAAIDVAGLTREELREIRQRVLHGEHIAL